MNKVCSIFFLLLLFSCENEVNINMNNSGLPVTYCILNMEDTIQNVRLAKSFFPKKGYSNEDHMVLERWNEPVEIYIEEWNNPDNPVVYEFHQVDIVRQDTGFFADPSFILYQAIFKPLPNVKYYLYLWFPERNYHAFASTMTVDKPEIINPAAIPGRSITFSDMDDFTVEFRPPVNSGFHQFSFILTVEENTGEGFHLDYFDFGGEIYEENNSQLIQRDLSSARFYSDLLNHYDTLKGTDNRRINGLEFVVYSYGQELRFYNQLYNNGNQPWEIQSYTSFKNGFGLFSSESSSRTANLELSPLTYQILTKDPRYTHLKFVR